VCCDVYERIDTVGSDNMNPLSEVDEGRTSSGSVAEFAACPTDVWKILVLKQAVNLDEDFVRNPK
jgi:hypothetical protein